jgi:hypothetical protein
MNQYIVTKKDGTVQHLGTYSSLEEISKLRVFKNNPLLLQRVSVLDDTPAPIIAKPTPIVAIPKKVKAPKSYNRWRLIYSDSYIDYTGYYTAKEIRKNLRSGIIQKIRLVSKGEYHINDGEI